MATKSSRRSPALLHRQHESIRGRLHWQRAPVSTTRRRRHHCSSSRCQIPSNNGLGSSWYCQWKAVFMDVVWRRVVYCCSIELDIPFRRNRGAFRLNKDNSPSVCDQWFCPVHELSLRERIAAADRDYYSRHVYISLYFKDTEQACCRVSHAACSFPFGDFTMYRKQVAVFFQDTISVVGCRVSGGEDP